MSEPLRVHGLDLSYFTGKVEAYLRAKGLPYRLIEMDTRDFAACGRATGVRQMPQIECADGTWLTDSTLILDHLERTAPGPGFTPEDPLTRVVALLIEDMADEALWRPALYYRWAFADDARLMSGRLARGMLRDVPLPFALRRLMILNRQRLHFLRRDGVRPDTAPAVEALARRAFAAMEEALAVHPFVLGQRPTAADFGLFGPFFRHFFCDPTPARLMRDTAPRTLAWVTRLWGATPESTGAGPLPDHVPEAARGLLRLVAESHLPQAQANAEAVAAGARRVTFIDQGARFDVPVSPYRAWAFDRVKQAVQALDDATRGALAALIGDGAHVLFAPSLSCGAFVAPVLPITAPPATTVRDRGGRG